MLLSELMKNTDVQIARDVELRGITCRWQDVRPGWLYVCRVGTETDGHRFAARAATGGAAAILSERDTGHGDLITADTATLWPRLCERWFGRPTDRLRVIGVTGTNGKTTVCHMVWSILTALGHRVGLVGTVANRIGHLTEPAHQTTPDAYELGRLFSLMAADGCTHAVMEVSSHALAQHRVDGTRFAVGVFTNLTRDHLDYHRTIERYTAAKRRLFSRCEHAVVNVDDPASTAMLADFFGRITRFSRSASTDLFATDRRDVSGGVQFSAHVGGQTYPVYVPMPGDYSVSNALAAIGAVCAVGVDPAAACRALGNLPPVRGRAETVAVFRGARIVIDYAHTPDGLEQVLAALRPGCTGTLSVLFGCGGDRDRDKRPMMGRVAARLADRVIVTSDNPRREDPMAIIADVVAGMRDSNTPYTVIPDRKEAIAALIHTAADGDVLLLAGKGHETDQILADRTVPFDERRLVTDCIKREEDPDEDVADDRAGSDRPDGVSGIRPARQKTDSVAAQAEIRTDHPR